MQEKNMKPQYTTVIMHRNRELYFGGCCGLFVCSTAPPYLEIYIYICNLRNYIEKKQILFLDFTCFKNFHDLCSKYEECIDLIANVEGTHQAYKEPIIDGVCIDMRFEYETHINLLGSVWASISVQKLFRVQNYTKML